MPTISSYDSFFDWPQRKIFLVYFYKSDEISIFIFKKHAVIGLFYIHLFFVKFFFSPRFRSIFNF